MSRSVSPDIMTETQIDLLVTELMSIETSSTNVLTQLHRLNENLPKFEICAYEKIIYDLIIKFLRNKRPELQLSALSILFTCFKKGLYQTENDLDMAYLVVNIAHDIPVDDVDLQELWLKAFTVLEVATGLHEDLYRNRTVQMVNIFQKVLGSVSSSLQKINAIKMLNHLIKNIDSYNLSDVDRDLACNTILDIWVELIYPMMYNMNQQNLQLCAIEQSNDCLSYLQTMFQLENKSFTNFTTSLKTKYVPIMIDLVSQENIFFAKLWIFLMKLLGPKFHKGFPMVNMLLRVPEAGFKSQSNDVKEQTFYCWQALIDSFVMNPSTMFSEKRVNLLTIPLKSTMGRAARIVEVKFNTWFKLMNGVAAKRKDLNNELIVHFLVFCFGPFYDRPLSSWSSPHSIAEKMQAKRFKDVYLLACKSFLQLFGHKKYIDEELNSKLKYFDFECPKINMMNIADNSRIIVDSVGESCVMLSDLQQSDRFECAAINLSLWKSLFNAVDTLTDEKLKQTCTEQISALILALAGVARKKSSLINFGLVPLFNILTSGEFTFFKNEEITGLLFIPMIHAVMRKDNTLLQYGVLSIFKKIFAYKRNEKNFLKFVQMVLQSFSIGLKEKIEPVKSTMLSNIWLLLQEELIIYLHNTLKSNIDEKVYTSVFCEFFTWPFLTLHENFNQQQTSTKWQDLFHLYGQCTSGLLKNKLSLHIIQNLYKISNMVTVAEITYFLIKNLSISDCTKDNSCDISEIYSLVKTFLQKEDITSEPLQIFEKCVQQMFTSKMNLVNFPYFLFDPMLDCVECLVITHKTTAILDTLSQFVSKFKYTIQCQTGLEKLCDIMKKTNYEKELIDSILCQCSFLISGVQKRTHKLLNSAMKKTDTSSDTDLRIRKSGRKWSKSPELENTLKQEKITLSSNPQIEKPSSSTSDTELSVRKRSSKSSLTQTVDSVAQTSTKSKPTIEKTIESDKQQLKTVLSDLQNEKLSSDDEIIVPKRGRKSVLKVVSPECVPLTSAESEKTIESKKQQLKIVLSNLQNDKFSSDTEILKRSRKSMQKVILPESAAETSTKAEKTIESEKQQLKTVLSNLQNDKLLSDTEITKRSRKSMQKVMLPESAAQTSTKSEKTIDSEKEQLKAVMFNLQNEKISSSDSEVSAKIRNRKSVQKVQDCVTQSSSKTKSPNDKITDQSYSQNLVTMLSKLENKTSSSDTEISVRKSRKAVLKIKDSPLSVAHPKPDIEKTIEQSEKQQIVTLLGHDVETMSPVKLKGSLMPKKSKSPVMQPPAPKKQKPNDVEEIVFVDTPYKFDPKKLTKGQRERLSKRRDDIPAMYEDLSQSQTRDFSSNSNSILEETKTDKTKDKNDDANILNPFSELITKVTEAKTNETDVQQSATIVDTKTTDDKLPTDETEPVVKTKRGRRKSVNIPIIDTFENVSFESDNAEPENILKEEKLLSNFQNEKTPSLCETEISIGSKQSSECVAQTSIKSKAAIEETIESEKQPKNILKGKCRRRKSITLPIADTFDSIISFNSHYAENILNSKEIMTELNSIENKKESKIRKRRNSEYSEVVSPLNTAKLEINSADLNSADLNSADLNSADLNSADLKSGNIENVPIVPPKKKRGRKPKHLKVENSEETDSQTSLQDDTELSDASCQPRKSHRGRKPSIGKVKPEKISPISTQIEILPVEELDIATKQRVNRELQRIKLDINHSDEYQQKTRQEKRKTRMSGSFHSFLEANESPKSRYKTSPNGSSNDSESPCNTKQVSRNIFSKDDNLGESSKESSTEKSSTEKSEEVIENSQESEINIKQCQVPVLYPLENVKPGEQIVINTKDSKMDVVKGPELTSPFKILETASVQPKMTFSKHINFDTPEDLQENQTSPKKKIEILSNILLTTPLKHFETKLGDTDNTESINSEIMAAINTVNPEVESKNGGLESRKVLFDTLTENSLSPPRGEQKLNNIQTSPVNTDTPTRNKELVRNTSDLSPIKTLKFDDDVTFVDFEIIQDDQPAKPAETSPELFNSEPGSSGFKPEESERVGNNSPHPLKIKKRKSSLQLKSTRTAQMMDMVSAKNTMTNSTHIKKPKESKVPDSFFSPPHNRIMKMMGQFEKNEPQELISEEETKKQIKDEDILTFSRELPSPFASPSVSILKKRKISEDSDEIAIQVCKRRRVNFSDPPVTSHKYYEKASRQRHTATVKLDFSPEIPSTSIIETVDIVNDSSDITDKEAFLSSLIVNTNKSNESKIESVFTAKTSEPEKTETKVSDKIESVDQQKSYEVSVIINNENSKNSVVSNTKESFNIVPSTSRDRSSILNEEITGGTIRNVFCNVIEVFNEKKLNVLPLVKLLLGGTNNFSISLKENIIRYISKDTQYFTESLKFIDCKVLGQSLVQFSKTPDFVNYRKHLFDIVPSIIENPNELVSSMIPKLSVVDLGNAVIRKMDSNNTNEFLKQIYETMPLKQYLNPVRKEELLPKVEILDNDDIKLLLERVDYNIDHFSFITSLFLKKYPAAELFLKLATETIKIQNNPS